MVIICASYWLSDSLLSWLSWRRTHVLRSSRQMGQRLSRSEILVQQGRQTQCVQRVGRSVFIGPSHIAGFSWHTGHSSVLFSRQRRSHSCLFSSRIRGVMSGLVSTLGVKDGDTTCSMKMLALKKHTATPSGRRLLGTCDHTPGTGGNVGYRAVSQVTHMVFVTSSKRVPSARRQNTNDIVWRYGRQRLR